jgi:hypothetical protein
MRSAAHALYSYKSTAWDFHGYHKQQPELAFLVGCFKIRGT